MFGLSFGELVVLLIVAVLVLGPKELPTYLRKAGQLASRLRRMAFEMREKSGIDEVLRTEGIDRDIAEIRRLARGEINGVVSSMRSTVDALHPGRAYTAAPPVVPASTDPATAEAAATAVAPVTPPAPEYEKPLPPPAPVGHVVERAREYPQEGADSYGALPDTALVYEGALPPSPLADDALYTRGAAA